MDKDGDCVVKLCEVVVKLSAAAGVSCSIDPSRLLVRICGEVWNYNISIHVEQQIKGHDVLFGYNF